MSSFLKLYYLFQETSTLSNNVALLCKASLMTYGSYDSSSAITWCAANVDTFAATSFYEEKTLISYTVTTPMSSAVASTVLTRANRVIFNSTLWDNGFFSGETSLAAVIDVENGETDRTMYAVAISLYSFFLMVFTWIMYVVLKHKQCGNPCAEKEQQYEYDTSDDESDDDDSNATQEEEVEPQEDNCCRYKGTVLHALFLLLNASLILTYGIVVYTDTDYIESKTMIGLTEHFPFVGLPVFSVFLF